MIDKLLAKYLEFSESLSPAATEVICFIIAFIVFILFVIIYRKKVGTIQDYTCDYEFKEDKLCFDKYNNNVYLQDSQLNNCPFCRREAHVVIVDDYGDIRPIGYEKDPVDGLHYGIAHTKGIRSCPIATENEYEIIGKHYDDKKQAERAWNSRTI